MGRWEPNTSARLAQAAMELFAKHGYASTTVEDIAARAGLTERTFFRYFADKREVLFSGSSELETAMTSAIAEAPAKTSPVDLVAAAIEAMALRLQGVRDFAHVRARKALVDAHAELRERELIKMETLGRVLADALRARGIEDPRATLGAEAGIAVFRVAFEQWAGASKPSDFVEHVRLALRALRALLGARATR